MKKLIFLILILMLSVTLAGCGKDKKQEVENTEAKKESKGGFQVLEEDNSLFGWLKRGKGVECILRAPEGDMVILAKNDKVLIEGMPSWSSQVDSSGKPQTGTMLTTTEWSYMWAGNTGTKWNNKKLEELAGEPGEEEESDQKSWEDMVVGWEEADINYDCKEKKLSDKLFEVPENVEFSDMGEILEEYSAMGEDMGKKLEAGEEVDLSEMEDMIEKMKNETGISE